MSRVIGLRRFVAVAWRAGAGLSVVTVATIVLSAAAPIGAAVALGQVVAAVVAPAGSGRAVVWAVIAAGCLLLQWISGALQRVSATTLGERVDVVLQHDLMRAVSGPSGVRSLE